MKSTDLIQHELDTVKNDNKIILERLNKQLLFANSLKDQYESNEKIINGLENSLYILKKEQEKNPNF